MSVEHDKDMTFLRLLDQCLAEIRFLRKKDDAARRLAEEVSGWAAYHPTDVPSGITDALKSYEVIRES